MDNTFFDKIVEFFERYIFELKALHEQVVAAGPFSGRLNETIWLGQRHGWAKDILAEFRAKKTDNILPFFETYLGEIEFELRDNEKNLQDNDVIWLTNRKNTLKELMNKELCCVKL